MWSRSNMKQNNRSKSLLAFVVLLLGMLSFAPTLAQEKSIVFWGGLIFSEKANNALVARAQKWGEENGVKVEVVMINQNETVQTVSAAIEAGTLPDVLDLGRDFMLLLSKQNQLVAVDDLYAEIGKAHGGWLKSADSLVTSKDFGGKIYGIPYATNGNVLYRRNDLLEPKGFKDAPKTWEELSDMARAINNPPDLYSMGFALSNVGDGNLTTTMLQSWGGRIADDTGKTCTIDSQATRDFLTWISKAYADGLFPPGATTWDGAGDNTAYQSGQAGFIANPGSVRNYLVDNDPELADATKYSALPAGPAMRISPVGTVVRSIPVTSKNQDLAAELIKYLADDDFTAEYYSSAIYGPALENHIKAPIFTESAVHAGLLDLALNGTAGAFPDVNNAAFAEYQTNFLTPRMVQRIVVDGLSIDDAIKETQDACQVIYDKNNT
ncbi:MAG: extracellular solute-binding protein [Anaerolineaceae bacterium]|nr:extracellular solute-binding protein [Anaerolineaceae bacterium]